MAVWNGTLFVTGGGGGGNPQSTVYSAPINSDGSVGLWTTQTNSLPLGLTYHAMSAWNGRLYVTGGYAGYAVSTVYSAALNPDGSVGSWTQQTNSLPQAIQTHAMSAWNGRLYVTGG